MDLTKYYIEEVMKLDSDGSTSLMNGLARFKHKLNVEMKLDEKTYDTYFSVNIDDIINSGMQVEDIIYLRNGGWEMSEDKKFLIRKNIV